MAIKSSPYLGMLLVLSHTIAAIVVFATTIPSAVRLAILILILLSLAYYLSRDALQLFCDSWREISFDRDRISVATLGGLAFSGRVASKTAVNPYFVVLCVRLDGHCLPVSRIIFPDALDTCAFRELCVHLRFSPKPP